MECNIRVLVVPLSALTQPPQKLSEVIFETEKDLIHCLDATAVRFDGAIRNFRGVPIDFPKCSGQQLVQFVPVQPNSLTKRTDIDFNSMLELGRKAGVTTRALQRFAADRASPILSCIWRDFRHLRVNWGFEN